jgi:hypothetical protein
MAKRPQNIICEFSMDEWMKFYYETFMEKSWMKSWSLILFHWCKWLIIEGHEPHKCPFSSNYDLFF